jgi:uncharacterized protein YbjT (DUF2867 family)
MSNKILITGATGNLGRSLTAILKEKDADFFAGIHHNGNINAMKRQKTRAVKIRFNSQDNLTMAMQGIDIIFMLVPLAEQMVNYGRNIINAAIDSRVKFILRSSCLNADIESPHTLFKAHGELDRLVMESGIPYAILRPNTYMQNFINHLGPSIRNARAFYLPQGTAKTSLIDIRDIATVASEILLHTEEHRNMTYELTGPEALSNYDTARILSYVTGDDITYFPIDDHMARENMLNANMPLWNINAMMDFHYFTKKGRMAIISNAVKELTGRTPSSFEDFARENSDAWRPTEIFTA